MRRTIAAASLVCAALFGGPVHAEVDEPLYNPNAGKNRPAGTFQRDRFGNAEGGEFDLGKDDAFKGQKIAVLHLYDGEGFDFSLPRAALAEKGFELIHWKGPQAVPTPDQLKLALKDASQLWVISNMTPLLTPQHHAVIRDFFHSGRGLYLWGDNEPYYADANALASHLFGARMTGNLMGNQTVGPRVNGAGPGFTQDHLLTTGIERLYEGVTIATLHKAVEGQAPPPQNALHNIFAQLGLNNTQAGSGEVPEDMVPLLYGSAGNLVSAFYEKGGRRAIIDGGFTRLFKEWDTAGSARYVKNAAVWLTNLEGKKKLAELSKPWYLRTGASTGRRVVQTREYQAPRGGLGSTRYK